jgi:hypothetical protein
MCLTPDDHMIEAFTADRPDRTFDISILSFLGIGMLRKNQLDFLCDWSVHAGLGADGKHLRDPLLPGLFAGL